MILLLPAAVLGSAHPAAAAADAGKTSQDQKAPSSSPKRPVSSEQPAADEDTLRNIDHWEEAVAANPEDVTLRLALGNAYALNNHLVKAVQEYRKALKSYPEYKIGWNNLGSAYRALNRNSQALWAYRRALELDPHYGLAYYNIGVVYDNKKRYRRAIQNYGLAFRYDPGLIEVRKNPQVVTNRHLYAVLLSNYLESEGSVAIPLEPAFRAAPEE